MNIILKNLFDWYTLNARVKPVLIIILPLLMIILIWFPETMESYNAALTVILSFGIISLLSSYFATIGRKKENKIFHQMGGKPTTVILRHQDNTIDSVTKRRYRTFLSRKLSITFPEIKDEISNSILADIVYESAIRYLRTLSRDRIKYPLVYQENINYGFARNLYAAKIHGIVSTLLALLVSIFAFYNKYMVSNNHQFSCSFIIKPDTILSLLVVLGMLGIWCFMINIDFVRERAYAYARALLEICESIEN